MYPSSKKLSDTGLSMKGKDTHSDKDFQFHEKSDQTEMSTGRSCFNQKDFEITECRYDGRGGGQFESFIFFDKTESGRIYTISQTGRLRAVVENMAEMSFTPAA